MPRKSKAVVDEPFELCYAPRLCYYCLKTIKWGAKFIDGGYTKSYHSRCWSTMKRKEGKP